MLALFDKVSVKSVSHVTGGGFYENIPRAIPDGLCAKIYKDKLPKLPIFELIAKCGNIPERDMYNTFNMGIGMAFVVDATEADAALAILAENGEDGARVIGEITVGGDKVVVC